MVRRRIDACQGVCTRPVRKPHSEPTGSALGPRALTSDPGSGLGGAGERDRAIGSCRIDQPPGGRQQVAPKRVVDPDSLLLGRDQPRGLELANVVRDGWLTEFEGGREVTDANRLLRSSQRGDDLESSRVRQRLEDFNRLLRYLGGKLNGHLATLSALSDRQLVHNPMLSNELKNVN